MTVTDPVVPTVPTPDLVAKARAALLAEVGKGLDYATKPHRMTPGPGGKCLFCSHTQSWHAQNKPRSPDEVAAEARSRQTQQKHSDKVGRLRMLTKVPTE